MTFDRLRTYCLSLSTEVTEDLPFGPDTLVFRFRGRIFLLTPLDVHPPTMNVKCDPARAIELREQYDAVRPGYHMNKRHWNTVVLDGSIPDGEIRSMVDHSFQLIAAGNRPASRSPKTKKRIR